MVRVREKVAWAIAVTLALLVVASLAGVARSGPLDPPGPPASTGPIQVQIVTGTSAHTEYTTVLADCLNGSAGGVASGVNSARVQLNALGADSWSIVGPPNVSTVAYPNGGSICSLTYTLQRPLGVGTPLPTPTNAVPTQTPTNAPVPPTATATP